MEPTQTIKMYKKTLKLLRLIHAETEESLLKILDRLIKQEYRRVNAVNDEAGEQV